jgi:hypothetical protein
MSNGEWEQLVQMLTAAGGAASADELAERLRLPQVPDDDLARPAERRIEDLAAMLAADRQDVEINPAPAVSTRAAETDESGDASGFVKTAGMITGAGSLVTGLMKLFGGDDERENVADPVAFQLPAPVSIEAGVAQDGSVTAINYSQSGTARAASPVQQAAAPQIQIHVQAMDSRSFLDHRDEIARAVREAMLHSHSLNDVVAEI